MTSARVLRIKSSLVERAPTGQRAPTTHGMFLWVFSSCCFLRLSATKGTLCGRGAVLREAKAEPRVPRYSLMFTNLKNKNKRGERSKRLNLALSDNKLEVSSKRRTPGPTATKAIFGLRSRLGESVRKWTIPHGRCGQNSGHVSISRVQ